MEFLRLEIGLLDSLRRQWNGSEDINVIIFSNFSLIFSFSKCFEVFFIFVKFVCRPMKLFQALPMGHWTDFKDKKFVLNV